MKITDLDICIKMANDYLKYEREKASQRGNEDYVAGYMEALVQEYTGPSTGLELRDGYLVKTNNNIDAEVDLDKFNRKFSIKFNQR